MPSPVDPSRPPTPASPARPPGALQLVRQHEAHLPPTLHRVAQHVLTHPAATVYLTITELATAAGVVESAVTRFCQRLGYPGFQAFKIDLSRDLSHHLSHGDRPDDPDPQTPAARAAAQAVQAANGTRDLDNDAALQRVAEALARARRILVTGQGQSGLSAQYLAQKLARLGLNVTAHTDPHLAAVAAATHTDQDVHVAVTRSGSTLDTLHTLRLAAARGALTVAVTHATTSPVTREAHETLLTASPEHPLDGGAVGSLVAQAVLCEALTLHVTALLPGSDTLLQRTASSVARMKP